LPCVRCKYDLKGLSIRGACPECGTPVRATLLAVVDPKASELQPIPRPRLVAAGLVAWSFSAVLALLCGWCVWLLEVLPAGNLDRYLPELRYSVLGFLVFSGLGAVVLISPHADISRRRRVQAALGAMGYLPLAALAGWLLLGHWNVQAPGTLGQWAATTDGKTAVEVVADLVAIGVVLLLRPNARLLAARSVLLREGRVDRQTLLGLVMVLIMAIVGECLTLIGLATQAGETFVLVGQMLVLIGAVLFTLGMVGVAIDCWRIRGVVVQPPLSLESLLEPAQPTPAKPA
jgi:hypothetical protein